MIKKFLKSRLKQTNHTHKHKNDCISEQVPVNHTPGVYKDALVWTDRRKPVGK